MPFNKEFPYRPKTTTDRFAHTVPCFCDNGKNPEGLNCKVCGGTGRRPVKNKQQIKELFTGEAVFTGSVTETV